MSIYNDWIDWIGGYPYEVSKPDKINSFFRKRFHPTKSCHN